MDFWVPKTHHACRLFRLSCGCLRDYPGMAATGKQHEVLCPACRCAAHTLYVYPEKVCAESAIVDVAAGVMKVSCTNALGNKNCQAGVHHDEFVKTSFTLPGKLRKSDWGQTGRV